MAKTEPALEHLISKLGQLSLTVSLSGCLGLALCLPAWAGKLQYWQFDPAQNRLEIRTEGGVQPRAQLISDPTRLVIDLPGIILGWPSKSRPGQGAVRSVRIAQFDRDTTRIVVELAPGYTLDPNAVRFRGLSPSRWLVQLPPAQPLTEANNPFPGNAAAGPAPARANAGGQVLDFRTTGEGLLLGTSGSVTNAQVERSRNRRRVEVTLEGLNLSPRLEGTSFRAERFGVNRVFLQQVETDPPKVRMTMEVDPDGPDWQISLARRGGVALVPIAGTGNLTLGNSTLGNPTSGNPGSGSTSPTFPSPRGGIFTQSLPDPSSPNSGGVNSNLATILSIDLGGDELLIRSDRQLAFVNRWEGNRYRITVRRAQFSPQLQQPRLALGSAIDKIQLRQDDAQTVTIFLTPASGIKIRGARLFSSSNIANGVLVQLDRGDEPLPDNLPEVLPPSGSPVPTPAPEFPVTNEKLPAPSGRRIVVPEFPVTNEKLPAPSGRRIVVIDPGHGGRDPGAIGIGGIREKDIVMEISQEVTRLLQQQGVIVQMTRTNDQEVDLAPRVAIAERANADVFVSIHANAINMSRPDINGLEVFYSPGRPRSARLAKILHDTIVSNLNVGTRGLKVARFYVIRNTSMPSALVEVGYVTGAVDARNLADPNWRRQMARAIAQGILQYLQTQS